MKAISTFASSGKRMRFWTFTDAFGSFRRFRRVVKATSHSTIFDIPMHPVREDQRHRRRFTRERHPVISVMVIIPLNVALCTLPSHGNHSVRSSLNMLQLGVKRCGSVSVLSADMF